MRPLLSRFAAALILMIMASGGTEQPKPEVALVFVPLGGATMEQISYGRYIAEMVGREAGPFTLVRSPLTKSDFRDCFDRSLVDAVTCARSYLGHEQARTIASTVVVFLANPNPDASLYGGGLAVSCVGVAQAPSHADRQTIGVNPASQILHTHNAMNRDIEAMNACITAASEEAGTN